MKPHLFPVIFMHKTPSNVQNIIPSIFMFSVNSLLSPFPPAAGIGPGSGNDLGMEDIFIQPNIAVHQGSNMSFWLLHAASECGYQKCLAILSMLKRAFKGGHALLRAALFLWKLPFRSLQGNTQQQNQKDPLVHSYGFKNISCHNGVNSCFLRVRKTLRAKHRV